MRRTLRFACFFLLLALAGGSALAQNGIISTVAGGGPNNMPALDAGIGSSSAVATDSAGNFYFTSFDHSSAVFKVNGTGTLTRFAGTGTNGYSGDGGPAIAAQIGCVYGLAFDSAGNLYLADPCNYHVRKVDASTGIISTVAGNGAYGSTGDGGPATSASLSPYSVAVDTVGNIFIADLPGNRIRRVDAGTGTISTVAGNGLFGHGADGVAATNTNLGSVIALILDGAGNLFFTDYSYVYSGQYCGYYNSFGGCQYYINTYNYYSRVRKIDASTQIVTTVAGGLPDNNGCSLALGDGGSATSAGLCYPVGLAFDNHTGNLYISDRSRYRIRKVDSSSTITTFAGNGAYGFSGDGAPATNASLSYTWGVALDGSGDLYIADSNNSRVRRVDASTGNINTVAGNGLLGSTASGIRATDGELYVATSSVLDSGGSLFIADQGTRVIRRVDTSSGLMYNYAGSGNFGHSADGTAATAANFGCPYSVALDSAQNVYLVDVCSYVVQKIDRSTGLISTVAGVAGQSGYNSDGIAATSSYLGCPYGIAFDSSDNLYVADTCNHRIRKVDHATGLISTVAGNGTNGFYGDGGLATSANLSYPYGVTVDRSNNLIIADEGNQRVRRVDASTGVITTIAGGGSDHSTNGITATSAAFNCAVAVASDSAGDVFISDLCAEAIRKVDFSGNIYTVAGTVSSYGFSGDGGLATSAMLANPWGIFVSAAGDLYIADQANQRIRKVKGVTASSNQPPIANAGQNQTVEATSAAGATVVLDSSGSSDPDGDTLTYTWTGPFGTATGIKPPVAMPLGTNTVSLKVDDGHGNTATATVQITVIDTTPPVLTLPGNIAAHASSASGAVVTFTASANDIVSGALTPTCTPASGSTFPIGVTRVNCTALDGVGNVSSGSFTVTVSTFSQSITFAGLPDKKYGDAAFNVSASSSSSLPVSFTAMGNCSVSGATVMLGVVGSCTVTAHQAGDATYSAATDVPQTFVIGQVAASVTPAAAGKIYGTSDPGLTGTLTGFLVADNVTATYSRAAGETVTGSPYTISATLGPAGVLSNYNITYNTASFTINKANASVTPAAAGKIYGTVDPGLTGTLTSFLVTDNVTAAYSRTAGETVAGSPYTISSTLSPAAVLGNYNITYNTASFTINKANASVTPAAAGKIYGTVDPGLTGTLTGFLVADNVTAAYSRTAGETVAGSPYTISSTLSPAAVLGNYNITYNTTSFTIAAAPASVAPYAAGKTYGTADPALGGTLTGFLAVDNVTAIYTRTPGEAVAGSPYIISATLSPVGALGNYSITYNTASFVISRANASVTPAVASKIYGAADPVFTGTLTGFLAADNVMATYSRNAGEAVAGSPYSISATLSPAAVLGNYNITYNTANFSITPKSASVTPNPASKTYGTLDPAFAGTLAGFLPADNVTASYTRNAGETVVGSPYTISATLSPAGVLANYAVTYNTASFTINKANASVTPAAASKIYGAADPALTGTLSGFVAADGVTATYSRTAGETVAGGPYIITAALNPAVVLTNYNVTYNTALFTITKATLTVTANSTTKILDAANPALNNATYSGFKFSDGPGSLGGTLSCATTAGTTSPVGSYPITCSGLTAANYAITYMSGTLKILYAPAGPACAGNVGKTILQPVNADGTSVWKAGRTIPVKFVVCDANGVSIGTPGVVSSFLLTGIWNGTIDLVDETVSATNADTAFRWDGSQWIFNLSTSGLSAGRTYIYTIALNDGTIVTGTTLAGAGNASFQYGLR